MKKKIIVFMAVLIPILLFNSGYSLNDTENLLYLQAYFNKRNVEKVNDYHTEMTRYSANLKINDYQ
ncbi:hypothetical protein FM755_02485 [Francisella tularensis]|uniref:Uncharacterized protein n=3 Tax=Francisella tularensis TaxID=263 RepID=A0AAI8BIV4_FRATH|nr:hypothetical protein [Francisella tularensis]ABI82759.1 hypothetical protein FTH_0835 [Francisella tularensis subsp. holarctica OSU18]AJI50793.1 hypothetical protein DA46_1961 [Francisella tularensis subsp. holarctica]AJI59815.1 hypothetical protein AW21_1742 [Francisella tularensis subsp. holarctica LVS]AJI64031.1 hypothetical protein CH67_1183 [Francisella tularensis subsp. holarctica]AJI67590.1 hypothetical protein CH68_915 [Francisella tularensis subsp. holarctica]